MANLLEQSVAPLRKVTRVQFGILGPDEIKGKEPRGRWQENDEEKEKARGGRGNTVFPSSFLSVGVMEI
jgi:hypothetical protein